MSLITENDINIENMIHLTDDHLKELQVSMGQRIIFNDKIKLYKNHKHNLENEQNILNMNMVC